MIPGPVEVSPGVRASLAAPPPGHLAPSLIEAFGSALGLMREVWMADAASQPFVVAGGGTLAMEMAVANLIEAGDRAVVVGTGYFSDRLAEMLRRQRAEVLEVSAPVGEAPSVADVVAGLERESGGRPFKALFATHVDTSTGVRLDPAPLARLARDRGLLAVFDGVCATAGERFEMNGWGADVYLTASQKALGLPPGLALMVVSPRALEVRRARAGADPPLYLDWAAWLPVMQAYEERRPAYFSTPATSLILALEVGLREILATGLEARLALHERAARGMRAAWQALGLRPVPAREDLTADTMSALYYPEGIDASVLGRILSHGVVVAGGLHPAIRTRCFRVGHMGYTVSRPELLARTVEAVGAGLRDAGADADPRCALDALRRALAGAF